MTILTDKPQMAAELVLQGREVGKTRWIVQFNKDSGAYITTHLWHENHALETVYSKYLEVEFDPSTHTVMGDYDDFQVVLIQDKPVVIREQDLDSVAAEKVTTEFSVGKQLNTLAATLRGVAKELGLEVPELEEMSDQIAEVLRKNDLRKQSYANSPEITYLTKSDIIEQTSKQMEGGRHEAIGAREAGM